MSARRVLRLTSPYMQGENVRELQEALVANNFYPDVNAPDYGIDGYYGPATEDAVRRYQSVHGLYVDGIAGAATFASLGLTDDTSTGGSSKGYLTVGDTGEDVRRLQQALVDNNFYPEIDSPDNGVDGVFGLATEDAVRRYQTIHGLTVDGIAGPATLASLGITLGGGTGGSGDYGDNVLSRGDSGPAVRELQQALVDNNFYPDIDAPDNGVDGVFGPDTEDAVRRYQTIHGLTVDGIAGPETLASLGLSGETGGSGGYGDGVLSRGDSGPAVRELQQALVDNNFYPDINAPNNGVDGVFGPDTEDAVRRYQTIHGLTVDGIAGPETLASLGLSGNNSGGGSTPSNPGGSDGLVGGGNIGDLVIRQDFIPITRANRVGLMMEKGFPTHITIHETANTDFGADAAMHAQYVKTTDRAVSWHYTVDDGQIIYQHLPIYEVGYHAGDYEGNYNSIGIELCVNRDGNFAQTRRNAAALVRQLMADYSIPLSNVVTHNYWSGKNCPANLLSVFDDFKTQVENSFYEQTPEPPMVGGVHGTSQIPGHQPPEITCWTQNVSHAEAEEIREAAFNDTVAGIALALLGIASVQGFVARGLARSIPWVRNNEKTTEVIGYTIVGLSLNDAIGSDESIIGPAGDYEVCEYKHLVDPDSDYWDHWTDHAHYLGQIMYKTTNNNTGQVYYSDAVKITR
ncbi:peptidoglycan-binding protein [Lentibacillus sediminis]|uniref:peptidoglycan recognition protein family protein n=1 Tax=Lentibacillus sediminis TaxID=1940529 RepID=UPI000C1BB1DC|nr:peptidoglycan-binding protein [Lentibacillus sediminis]